MRRPPDVSVFVGSVIAYSVLLSAVVWSLPGLRGVFYPHNSLIVIPVVSVILSARGVPWRRRLSYAGAILGTFLVIDYLFTSSGLAAYAWQFLGVGLVATALGVFYMVFAQAFPLGVLLLFAGRDPSILWVRPPSQKSRASSKIHRKR